MHGHGEGSASSARSSATAPCLSAWVATRLYHSRLLGDRALVASATGWLAAVLALYGLLAWLLSTGHFPHYLLVLAAMLAIPLARLSAAPLALAWNRHR